MSSSDKPLDFIRNIVAGDLECGRVKSIVTRFPPEPNGFLHIGHVKAFLLDFDLATENGGQYFLRMDDTNPDSEDGLYVENICEDIRWLGYSWQEEQFRYASDYFQRFIDCAIYLIEQGLAYVDQLSSEEVNTYRGSPLELGRDSPWRQRPVEESLKMFQKMRAGELADGEAILRARVDMQHPNVHMRDPVLYRIKHKAHHRQGRKWCIYPMYDFAHPLEDAIEGVSHSLCSIEFVNHRAFYDWLLEKVAPFLQLQTPPRQFEFARLILGYTVLSKRYLRALVEKGYVSGWDDPRMPTISGLRRRGMPAQALVNFVRAVGVTKTPSLIDIQFLYHHVREHLNKTALRRVAITEPLKLIIDNYPGDQLEFFELQNKPGDPEFGKRKLPFRRELWIEKSDFMEVPSKGFFRLFLGNEVRLIGSYFVRCNSIEYDENQEIVAVHCSYDPLSRGGQSPDGRRIKATIHWLACKDAVAAEFRFFDHLFLREDMSRVSEEELLSLLNPCSLSCSEGYVEKEAVETQETVQFLRMGYFSRDQKEQDTLCYNRTIDLKDSWKKKK